LKKFEHIFPFYIRYMNDIAKTVPSNWLRDAQYLLQSPEQLQFIIKIEGKKLNFLDHQ